MANHAAGSFSCLLSLNVLFIYATGEARELVERVVFPRVHYLPNNFDFETSARKIVELGDWILDLQAEGNLGIESGLQAEWHGLDGNVTRTDVVECQYAYGAVRGSRSAWTAVTLCGLQINGYMNIEGVGYTVRPMEANNSANAHVVRSRGDSFVLIVSDDYFIDFRVPYHKVLIVLFFIYRNSSSSSIYRFIHVR